MIKKNYKFQDWKPDPYLGVRVREGQDAMQAYRKLKKKLLKEGVLDEVRDRRYFVKPSEKRKLEKNRIKRMQAKNKKVKKNLY
tara:strand:- start:28 stop:276 length:249 start_codon:yes stop_codon:yes gene_type:complete